MRLFKLASMPSIFKFVAALVVGLFANSALALNVESIHKIEFQKEIEIRAGDECVTFGPGPYNVGDAVIYYRQPYVNGPRMAITLAAQVEICISKNSSVIRRIPKGQAFQVKAAEDHDAELKRISWQAPGQILRSEELDLVEVGDFKLQGGITVHIDWFLYSTEALATGYSSLSASKLNMSVLQQSVSKIMKLTEAVLIVTPGDDE